jgi:3-methyladenine DNA glycosylase AlkD
VKTNEILVPVAAERLRAKKLKRLNEDYHSHNEEFYENFRKLLKAAEMLGIYTLPSVPCKFNTPVLRRFASLPACVLITKPPGICHR